MKKKRFRYKLNSIGKPTKICPFLYRNGARFVRKGSIICGRDCKCSSDLDIKAKTFNCSQTILGRIKELF